MATNDATATAPGTTPFPSPRPMLTLVRGGHPAVIGPLTGPPGRGERCLLLAILEDAILTVQRDAHLLRPGKRRLQRETREWFLADDPYWPFSFVNVCEALGFDASKLRSGLAPWLDDVVAAVPTGPGGW
jgi:hypothetical protein